MDNTKLKASADDAGARLPAQDSATGRGIKTGVQTIIGAGIVFFTGLITTVNGVPGCTGAVVDYIRGNIVQIAGLLGLSSGIVSFVWNFLRADVKNY